MATTEDPALRRDPSDRRRSSKKRRSSMLPAAVPVDVATDSFSDWYREKWSQAVVRTAPSTSSQ